MQRIFPLEILQGFSSTDSFILMMSEPSNDRRVPILIGDSEAKAIILAKEQISTQRPMTHSLMFSMMQECDLTLDEVRIDRFEEGIFYAKLLVSDGINQHIIDSRPSDAIVLAILSQCPIYMEESVLKETGITTNIDEPAPVQQTQEPTLEELEELLRRYEEAEEYEKAAEIQKKIEELKNN